MVSSHPRFDSLPGPLRSFIEANSQPMPIPYRADDAPVPILRQSLLPYLPMVGFNPPYEEMYREARELIPMMVAHRSEYEDHRGWKSLVLHGLGATQTEGAERYGKNPNDPAIYGWTEVSKMAPVTTAFFRDAFHYDSYQRIRFMLLEPGGYVCPHTDFDYYTLGPVNIALNNPPGCEFIMKNVGVLPFEPGSIIKLALINQHAVYNGSDEPRLHMIVHGSPNPEFWQPRIVESYRQLVKNPRYCPLPT